MMWGLSGAEIMAVLCSMGALALLAKVASSGHYFSLPKACFFLTRKQAALSWPFSEIKDRALLMQRHDSSKDEIAADRTLALQHALNVEESLRHLTGNLLQCLDETEVLYAALQELAVVLDVVCGNTVLYRHFCPVTRSYLSVESPKYVMETANVAQQRVLELDVVSEYMSGDLDINGLVISQTQCFDHLTQRVNGLNYQICIQIKALQSLWHTVFFCPIMDDRGSLLGDIVLIRDCGAIFNDAEVHFVQQVANQCAIAIRQSQLYQASQTQVKELERLNQLKDDFLSTISHELRTPMSNIQMGIDALERHLHQLHHQVTACEDGGAPSLDQWTGITRCIQLLKDESQRESGLIEDLLNLSRLEAGTEPFLPTEMALRSWLSYIAEVFLTQTRRHHQQLVINVPHSLHPLTTDFTVLERIITELLQNACKYTPAGGSITLSAYLQTGRTEELFDINRPIPFPHPDAEDGDQAVVPLIRYPDLDPTESNREISMMAIQVSNTGIEIPHEECDRIFDKFYRIPSNDPWKHGGTGLGLALVKRLVEHLRGTIHAFSANQQVHMLLLLPLLPPPDLRAASYLRTTRDPHS